MRDNSGFECKELGSHHSVLTNTKLNGLKINNSSWICKQGDDTANSCSQDWRNRQESQTGSQTLPEQRPRSRSCSRNTCRGRKTWNTSGRIAGGSVLMTLELKNSRGPSDILRFTCRSLTNSHSKYGRKTPSFLNTPGHSVLNKACPQEKAVNQIPTCWGSIRAYLPSSLPGGRREIPNSTPPKGKGHNRNSSEA